VEKNSKWFYLSFPVAMLAFLTRYNMALIIFPIFLYIFINWDKIKNRWDIIIGMGLSLLVVLPFLLYLGIKFGNPLYSFMDFFRTSSTAAGSIEHFAYHPDPLYYLKNMHVYLGVQSLMVLLLALMGFAVYLLRKWRELEY
jgi:4-amino-4-deoxy-L-arabinose transferase-like glycosyltransferase